MHQHKLHTIPICWTIVGQVEVRTIMEVMHLMIEGVEGVLRISTDNIIIPLGTTTSVDIEIFNGLGIMVLK